MTPYIESLLKEADDYVARGYYTSPERYAAALREQAGEIAQLRELLNLYNLGGWTDAERLMKERDALRAENESLRKDAEEWRKLQAFHESMAMAAGLPEPNP